jgi:N-acetyl-beta-hexosaminidase
MKNLFNYLFVIGVFTCALVSCNKANYTEKVKGTWQIIPLPQFVEEDTSANGFIVDKNVTIVYPDSENTKRVASLLAKYIKNVTGVEVKTSTKKGSKGNIILTINEELKNEEGYQIDANNKEIVIKGGSDKGIFYGVQAIHKALPITIGEQVTPMLPVAKIKDFPRFGYRGFMIDVGRHFFSVDYIKEMIDVMAMHNINYFHWHLTEDQGWRIEIKKYPKLTEIGSKRSETIRCWETKEFDGVPYGGFYTQQEAKEIVQYAAERFITVIPEVDMPGHMLAALASYPEMGCTGGPYKVPTSWGVFADVLCGGNDANIQFAKDVLAELMEIFPSEYIHIGGDECPKSRWEKCPKCQQKLRNLV